MVTTGSYLKTMNVSIKEAKNILSELVRRAEAGETVVITQNGKPVAGILDYREMNRLKLAVLMTKPPRGLTGKPEDVQKARTRGINWEALAAYKKKHGIDRVITFIADDFNDPLPEDFLISPLPET